MAIKKKSDETSQNENNETVLEAEEVSTEEKMEKQTIKEKLDDIKRSINEQGEKTATKKDVWKGAAVTIISLTASILLGL